MANRFRRPGSDPKVSNRITVWGADNNTQGAAAGGDVDQVQSTGSDPAAAQRLKAVLDKLAELDAALEAGPSGELTPAAVPAAQAVVADIRAEIQQPQPNQRTLRHLLNSLGLTLAPAAALLAIVNGLTPLVEALIAQAH